MGINRPFFFSQTKQTLFNGPKEDWINGRRIINGTDKANLTANYARQYYAAISFIK